MYTRTITMYSHTFNMLKCYWINRPAGCKLQRSGAAAPPAYVYTTVPIY